MPTQQRRNDVDHSDGDASKPRTEHDLIFKTTFSLFLSDLIELVSPELAGMLDLRQPEFIEQEAFTDLPRGKRRVCDLVARRVPTRRLEATASVA